MVPFIIFVSLPPTTLGIAPLLGLKFIYSEKATKFCEIFNLILSYVVPVKSKVKILQNFVAFSENINFTSLNPISTRGADYAHQTKILAPTPDFWTVIMIDF